MFNPTGLGFDIFKKRYALHDNESWKDACERVARHVSSAEEGLNIKTNLENFNNILLDGLFSPGGRIMNGAGRLKGQLLNCFVVPTSDSREGWGKTVSDTIVIAGTGGGVGINCSPVRPRGTTINGTGGHATGAVSLMEIINAAGEVIKAGGGRRTALMLALNLDHGDISEFLDVKLNLGKLNNANISIMFNENPEDFFKKVKEDKEHDIKFRGKTIAKVSAKKLWKQIVTNMCKTGEPGILNGYLANKMSNVWYDTNLICTNPCGEIWLSKYESCCLGSLVLPHFIEDGKFNWDKLAYVIKTATRFLDDVLTVNTYPLVEVKEAANNYRRIGLGAMGLHDTLLTLGLKYNSDSGLEFVDKLFSFIKNCAYETSIELAKEKGSFPKFDADKFLKSGFCKTLKPSIRSKIKEHGIRNCALLTMAPTGTTSMVYGVSSGVEPMFAPAYTRRYMDKDERKSEVVIHPLLKKFIDEGKQIDHFQGTYDLSLRDHFEMQRTVQRHLDNSVSKTINVPQGISTDELSELFIEYFPELKGVTIYPDGSRENQPLTPMSLSDAVDYLITSQAQVGMEETGKCRSGKCDI